MEKIFKRGDKIKVPELLEGLKKQNLFDDNLDGYLLETLTFIKYSEDGTQAIVSDEKMMPHTIHLGWCQLAGNIEIVKFEEFYDEQFL